MAAAVGFAAGAFASQQEQLQARAKESDEAPPAALALIQSLDQIAGRLARIEAAVGTVPQPKPRTAYTSHMQVGGHAGSMRFDGDCVLKKLQIDGRGERESAFMLEVVPMDPFLRMHVPRAHGVREIDGDRWLVMDNLTAGMRKPIVMDLKMGQLTYAPDATEAKIQRRERKDGSSTTLSHGITVVGVRLPRTAAECGGYDEYGGKLGHRVDTEEQLRFVFQRFFRTTRLRNDATSFVTNLNEWFEMQDQYAFYASSLLFAYDEADHDMAGLQVKMIDFAHVHHPQELCLHGQRKGLPLQPEGRDASYIFGLRSLSRLLSSL
eukprot:SAG11_NODE_5147_length_1647_cov_1.390827_1_plen_322_part_00